jgi:hypothetical protein
MRDHRNDRIVAVGLLTARDLDVLGTGFKRIFPVDEDTSFDDLLAQIDGLTTGETMPLPIRRT